MALFQCFALDVDLGRESEPGSCPCSLINQVENGCGCVCYLSVLKLKPVQHPVYTYENCVSWGVRSL